DMARFGFLYLNDGCWKGQRMLPEGWVAMTVQPSDAFKSGRIAADPTDVAGLHFWLNRAVSEVGVDKPWPDAPDDTFAAEGHWGQRIYIIPSLDLVIARTADDRDTTFHDNDFLKLAMAVVP